MPEPRSTAFPPRSSTCCSKRAVAVFVAELKARKSSRPEAAAERETRKRKRYFIGLDSRLRGNDGLARRLDDLAVAVGGHGGHQSGLLHVLDQAGRAVVADAQVPLHEGDGSALLLD